MYVKTTTEYQNNPVIVKVVEAFTSGVTVAAADFNTAKVDELKAGAIIGIDSNRLGHVVKTVKIVAGGSASAPRINSVNAFKVGDFISDGIVSLEISAITVGETYDTLTFTDGSLIVSATDTVLFQAAAADLTNQGKAATATVSDTDGDFLTITIPSAVGSEKFNNLSLTISQSATDDLTVAFENGVLAIGLAKTTATKNNLSVIQAAVRALATIDGFNFSTATATGVDWDGKQTGITLTTPTSAFTGGKDQTAGGTIAPKYSPIGISLNPVDLTIDNQSTGVMKSGTVNEDNMQYPIDSAMKAMLPRITFESES